MAHFLGNFRGRWRILLGAMLGLSVCLATLIPYSIGVFISAFGSEFGWARSDVALSMTLCSLVIALGSAQVGRLADRVDPALLASTSMIAFGVVVVFGSNFVSDVRSLWIFYVCLSIVGLGTTPVVLLRPVVTAFSDARGAAIGIAFCGVGVGAMLIPQIATALVERSGWRAGYVGLGALAIAVAPVLWFALRKRPAAEATKPGAPAPELEGISLKEAWRTPTFWLVSGISFFGVFGSSGVLTHLIPMLRDSGVDAVGSAAVASAFGFASLLGRFGAGFALDRINGRLIALALFTCGAIGTLTILGGYAAAVVGAALVGFSLGALVDVIAYFITRYFGLRHHGEIFGWNYGMISAGGMTAPFAVGLLRDQQGDYVTAFTALAGFFAMTFVLSLFLGRYRYAVH